MKFTKYIPSFLKSKYLLAGGFFAVWMLWFDPKDIHTDMERRKKLQELEKSETHLSQQITDTKKELSLLKTNAKTIEQYAREKYLMKKDNEDLYIVASDSEETK